VLDDASDLPEPRAMRLADLVNVPMGLGARKRSQGLSTLPCSATASSLPMAAQSIKADR